MSKMRTVRKKAFAFLIMLCMLFSAMPVTADSKKIPPMSDNNFDIMFVVDCSTSMMNSDPNYLAREACNLLLDLASFDNIRAGYVFYSHNIIKSKDLKALTTQDDIDNFKKEMLEYKIQSNQDTDIGLALTKADELLKKDAAADRNPQIILLSDGHIEIAKDSDPEDRPANKDGTKRLDTDSKNDALDVAQVCSNNGTPIYTIGLNANGSVDNGLLQDMANTTKASYSELKTATELNPAVEKIYATMIGSNRTSLDVKRENGRLIAEFDIDGKSILVSNIIINLNDNTSRVEDLQIEFTAKGQSNKELVYPNQNYDTNISVIDSQTFTVVKLLRPGDTPGEGHYIVSMKDTNANITMDRLDINKMELDVRMDKERYDFGEEANIAVTVMQKNDNRKTEPIEDEDTLRQFNLTYDILDENEKVVGNPDRPLYLDSNTLTFTDKLDISAFTTGKIKIYVKATQNGDILVTGKGNADVAHKVLQLKDKKNRMSKIILSGPIHTTYTFDYEKHLDKDPSFSLKPYINDSLEHVSWSENDEGIVFSPEKGGSDTFELIVKDDNNNPVTIELKLMVLSSWVLLIAAIILLVLIVVIIILVLHSKKPRLEGHLEVELDLPIRLKQLTPVPATWHFDGRSISTPLLTLLEKDQIYGNDYMNIFQQTGMFELISRIKFTANKNGLVLQIGPKLPGVIMIQNQTAEISKGYSQNLRQGDTISLRYSPDGRSDNFTAIKISYKQKATQNGGTGYTPWDSDPGIVPPSIFRGDGFAFGGPVGGNPQGGPSFGGNPQGGPSFGGNSQGGPSFGGNPQGGPSFGGDPQGGPSFGGNPQGGPSFGGNPQGGPSFGGNSQGGPSFGGNPQGGPSFGGNPQGGPSFGGNPQGGPSFGGNQAGESVPNNSQFSFSGGDDSSDAFYETNGFF